MPEPRAAAPFATYRYNSPGSSPIYIGAMDDAEALREADRSLSTSKATRKHLQRLTGDLWRNVGQINDDPRSPFTMGEEERAPREPSHLTFHRCAPSRSGAQP